MGRLLLLFIAVPALELIILIQIGGRIGVIPTLILIVGTGIVGASLARQQGLGVLNRIRSQWNSGQVPALPILDGVIVLVAGALLITPGLLTDLLGFLCLVPASRSLIRQAIWKRLRSNLRNRSARAKQPYDIEVEVESASEEPASLKD